MVCLVSKASVFGLYFALCRYVRALGAFYLRLVGKPLDVYSYLEPLLNDYRKLRVITGSKMASHVQRDLKVFFIACAIRNSELNMCVCV